MNKKIITLVLIILLVINTIYWLNVAIRTNMLRSVYEVDRYRYWEIYNTEGREKAEDFLRERALERALEEYKKTGRFEDTFTEKMIKNFAGTGGYTRPLIILAISDVVLIAIYFMMSPLYKKE